MAGTRNAPDWNRPCSKCGTSASLLKFDTRKTRTGTVVRQSWCRDCKRSTAKQRTVKDRLKREQSARKNELYSIMFALQRLSKRVERLIDAVESDIVQ